MTEALPRDPATAPDAASPAQDAAETAPYALTRQGLLDGSVRKLLLSTPGLVLLSDEERERSLREMLESRPDQGNGIWLFGYGSLIWNPAIHYVESRVARVEGWRRSFCLSTPAGRGTPENPGIVLALDAGGFCDGVAFRVAEEALPQELAAVWTREMPTGAYIPRWVPLLDPEGHVFGSGIAFTINRASRQYLAGLTEEEAVRRLSTACGRLGSCAEYLFQTQAGLSQLGIQDAMVDHLAEAVTKAQARG
jgi:cation transport protein ChaC